ncbi:MAG: uncharacterized protein KVP18_001454 [Porospora cf. gigantea A]|uniref:uncharacterized protein n=1 Tax=Porospora cf. gigantea A TaxID=2853593 RepID=UPI0035596CCE|nr:MAG: hypothetical protein KVP18_001454 [Porospora cf. gigantea A]
MDALRGPSAEVAGLACRDQLGDSAVVGDTLAGVRAVVCVIGDTLAGVRAVVCVIGDTRAGLGVIRGVCVAVGDTVTKASGLLIHAASGDAL